MHEYASAGITLPMKIATAISQQRWIPYRFRRSALKRIAPSFLRNHAFETPMEGGLKFKGNLVNYIDRLVYFCGAHEKYMLHYLRDIAPILREARGKLTFMDVGANAGNHTLFMATIADNVLSFEPFERVRKQLEDNIALNGLTNVRVFPFGLGSETGSLPFYAGPDDNLGAASFREGHYEGNKLIGVSKIRVGDEVMEQEKLPRIDILKADVEGFEKEVLVGLEQTLERNRPICIIELSLTTREKLADEEDFYSLFPTGYKFFQFKQGDRDSGEYKIEPFVYENRNKIQDVIAIPKELARQLK